MKFLIEVLDDFPEEAKLHKHLIHQEPVEAKIHILLAYDNKSITAISIQSPILDEIPTNAILKITKIN
ncbi:hypothetical protein [Methyloradius palustris]|uniref:Uncharacterized protein n=1 Tax=Methyloradius palustris TaxID=2778876 RepID=A0A8D5FY96_9PROT|nr:hypothetical protein [Methyloradius palustris]BCM24349.1 hypothetical protein ZMTM_06080 [Methyloradius palustris]